MDPTQIMQLLSFREFKLFTKLKSSLESKAAISAAIVRAFSALRAFSDDKTVPFRFTMILLRWKENADPGLVSIFETL